MLGSMWTTTACPEHAAVEYYCLLLLLPSKPSSSLLKVQRVNQYCHEGMLEGHCMGN